MWRTGSEPSEDGSANGEKENQLPPASSSAGTPSTEPYSKSSERLLAHGQHCESLSPKSAIFCSSSTTCASYRVILLGNSTERLSLCDRATTLLLCKLIGLLSSALPQAVLAASLTLGMLIWRGFQLPAHEPHYQRAAHCSNWHLPVSGKRN